MNAILSSILAFLSLIVSLQALDHWQEELLALHEEWSRDYAVAWCSRGEALRKNLDDALVLLQGSPIWPKYDAAWQLLKDQTIDKWYPESGQQELCQDSIKLAYETYRQFNTKIPDFYPNWWIRWN